MNGCEKFQCECCGFCQMLARTAIPNIVFEQNEQIRSHLTTCVKYLYNIWRVKVNEWYTAHHGWIAAFNIEGFEYIGFCFYGQDKPIVLKWIDCETPLLPLAALLTMIPPAPDSGFAQVGGLGSSST
jgi:hypothetical protein